MDAKRATRRSDPRVTRRGFTLVELLTVMIIMVILMTVAMPAFNRLTTGTGVEAGSRMVGAQLRLARQEAIARRKRVAVLLPALGELTAVADAAGQGFRPCIVDRNNVWQSWVENTKWQFVPSGVVIADADNSRGYETDNTGQTDVSDIGASGGPTCRAVIFRPTGRVDGSQKVVTLLEGIVASGSMQIRNAQNFIDLYVDQYTGRISFLYPEDTN